MTQKHSNEHSSTINFQRIFNTYMYLQHKKLIKISSLYLNIFSLPRIVLSVTLQLNVYNNSDMFPMFLVVGFLLQMNSTHLTTNLFCRYIQPAYSRIRGRSTCRDRYRRYAMYRSPRHPSSCPVGLQVYRSNTYNVMRLYLSIHLGQVITLL